MNQPIILLERVAEVLADLPETIVFTGGATIALYLEEVSVPDIRPTDDVDCVVEITSRAKYYQLGERLRELGLTESTESGVPLCRWQYQGINIDIMPCDESVLGFTNRWYQPGIHYAVSSKLPSGREILIFSTPYLLASKIMEVTDSLSNKYALSVDYRPEHRLWRIALRKMGRFNHLSLTAQVDLVKEEDTPENAIWLNTIVPSTANNAEETDEILWDAVTKLKEQEEWTKMYGWLTLEMIENNPKRLAWLKGRGFKVKSPANQDDFEFSLTF